MRFALRAGLPLRGVVESLLRAYLDDGYGHFEAIPEVLTRELCAASESERADVAAAIMVIAGDAKTSREGEAIEAVAKQTLDPHGPRTERIR